jgi:hypothetical protein
MHDLEELEQKMALFILQRTQHQEMFHKLSGAIEVLQEMINKEKEELTGKEEKVNDINKEETQ